MSSQEQGLPRRKDFLSQPSARRANHSLSRLFGKLGYRVALISRGSEHLNKLANEINQSGGEVRHSPYIITSVILTGTLTVVRLHLFLSRITLQPRFAQRSPA